MSFNVSRNSAFRSFSAIGNSSDMRAASQHELMRKVPIGWATTSRRLSEHCGLLLQSHLILHLRILGFSDSGKFFTTVEKANEHWSRYCGCSLLKPRGT